MSNERSAPTDPASFDISLLARIADATKLREGPEGVAALLRAVLRTGPMPLQELARTVRLPLPVATAVRRELETAGLLTRNGGVALTEAGARFCETEMALAPRGSLNVRVPDLDASTVPELLGSALSVVAEHLDTSPPPVDVTLDQAPCTAETAVRRAYAMYEAGAVEGRRIVLLGDDDSMSVAIPAVARSLGGLPREIVVLELDAARCHQLEVAARRTDAPVEVIRHDFRDPLPLATRGRFDVFETDPPYTLDGLKLFVSRGLEAMRPEIGLPGFLSYADLPPADQLSLVRCLAELGLAPMRLRPSFNRYAGASILGSVGQFIDLRIAESKRTDALARYEGPLYTGEVRPRRRRYRCRACGTVTVVGAVDVFPTIDALKSAGCPECGERAFHREGIVRD